MRSVFTITSILVFSVFLSAQHQDIPLDGLEEKIASELPGGFESKFSRWIQSNLVLVQGDQTLNDSSYYWLWDVVAGSYVIDGRDYYTYDSQFNVITILSQDYEEGSWENSARTSNEYNDDNLLAYSTYEFGIGSNWLPYARFYYIYDDQLRNVEWGYQTYTAGEWKNFFSNIYEFDDQGLILTVTSRDWMTIAWVNDLRRIYTYDSEGKRLDQTVQDWDSGWVPSEYYTYTYNSEGLLDERRDFLWGISDWSLEHRILFDYDAAGNLVTETSQDHISGDFWSNLERSLQTFDTENNLLTHVIQTYDNAWINQQQFVYRYDTDANNISEVSMSWDSAWVLQDSLHNYFSIFSSVNDNQSFVEWTLSPNPVVDQIDFRFPDFGVNKVDIYSIDGVQQMSIRIVNRNDVSVNVSPLSTGIYIAVIQVDSQIFSRTFFKE